MMHIPGISDLLDRGDIPRSLMLLMGQSGSGKTIYCRQFISEGLFDGEYCIYVSSSLTNKQFRNQFSNIEKLNLDQSSTFINPHLYNKPADSQQQHLSSQSVSISSIDTYQKSTNTDQRDVTIEHSDNHVRLDKLTMTLTEIRDIIIRTRKNENDGDHIYDNRIGIDHKSSVDVIAPDFRPHNNRSIRIIIDSITHLAAIFGEDAVLKFVNDLSFALKDAEAAAIFTLTTPTNERFSNALSSILDGIIEMKLEDYNGSLTRSMRLLSIVGMHHTPSWINFKICDDGSLSFVDQSSLLTCMLCGKSIVGRAIQDSEFTFDSQSCLETYKKLSGVYGSNISEIGLPSEVVNVNFFFIDIVSLSDPSLSVKKQMEKIAILNKMIGSCEAYYRSPKEKKIILPTGDGMAIGFLLNPELPFQLSIQLHRRLRIYNRSKPNEDIIGVRIGLGSGPVFVVNDVRDNQNVWGPGIILARRVMDIGDNFHILLAERLAEELIALKDEYRTAIRLITNVRIKHGQTIKLYSAFSNEFGNPESPSKITEHFC
jgi:KaiC/GvpD/RAD55 family RecA-like ATPase